MLQRERSPVFPKEDLTRFIYKMANAEISLERRRYILSKANQYPDLFNSPEMYYEPRAAFMTRGLKHSISVAKLSLEESLSPQERRILLTLFIDWTMSYVNFEFFEPIFNLQANEAQRSQYLPKIKTLEIIGCYAQTELGHGSNIKGIETTATYDKSFDGFVLNSPTRTSLKWWIGGLAHFANHAIVIANLIINGTSYGPHSFLVPIRDVKSHELLPGITTGDIGPKFGLKATDNGFLKLEYVRIPRNALISKFGKVNGHGSYEILDMNGIKLLYYNLLEARSLFVTEYWIHLAKALTIAIRYSIMRRQFKGEDGQETQILNYEIQQYKLFTCLAFLYGLLTAASNMRELVKRTSSLLKEGNDSMLSYSHSVVCMYKAVVSDALIESVETCRRSCGGHGYLDASGLPYIYQFVLPMCTYEGDNSILIIQAAKYIAKVFQNPGMMTGRFEILKQEPAKTQSFENSDLFYKRCMHLIAYKSTHQLYKRYKELKLQGVEDHAVWNQYLQVEAVRAVSGFFAYCFYCDFEEGIGKCNNLALKDILVDLKSIWALKELDKWSGICSKSNKMNNEMNLKLGKIRPKALDLIEAFELDERSLCSAIGRTDGQIYEQMLWHAKNLNPINKKPVFEAIQRYRNPRI